MTSSSEQEFQRAPLDSTTLPPPDSWNRSALQLSIARLGAEKWKFALVSMAVLIPCFWHRRFVAGDLGSHTYNAWLAHLIEQGYLPGLWIARQWTNVLFDILLSGLTRALGYGAGEKIAVSLAELVFFWGSFALVCAAARRPAWNVVPLLAMISYGWTFQMGFFNYYISLGLSFLGLAIFWKGKGSERWVALALLPLIFGAHPLGGLWLIGAGAYIEGAERLPRALQVGIFVLALAGILFFHFYLPRHFDVSMQENYPLYFYNGADQLVLFGVRYRIIEFLAIALALIGLAYAALGRKELHPSRQALAIALQLYILVELGVFLLPDGIRVRNNPAALALFTERITTVSAILICCALAASRPRRWMSVGWLAIALAFFAFVYEDTGQINRMQVHAGELVRTIPPNQRVMATILRPLGSRVLIQHIIDRACIGHCFSYGNYEPSSALFRVRARQGNPYVLTDFDLVASMEKGSYVVLAQDLPVYQIYQCSKRWTELCIIPLKAGEENDAAGVHPEAH